MGMQRCVVQLCLLFLLLSLPAQAGIWLEATGGILSSSETVNNVNTSDFRLQGTTTLGYEFKQGFLLGVQALVSRSSAASNYTWAWGPKGGVLIKGFELSAAYLPYATDNELSSVRTGSGFAFNLGYTYPLGKVFRLGLMVTYWQMNFNSQNGQTLNPPATLGFWSPQLALGFDL